MWPDIGRRLHAFVDRQAFGVRPFLLPTLPATLCCGKYGIRKETEEGEENQRT